PHKANPRASNMIQTLARMGWMYASGAPAMLDQQDVRAASMRVLNWTILPEASQTISTSLMRAKNMLSHLKINAEKMRDNFNCSKYFIMSESLTMSLARKIGREPAYNLVKNILNHASGEYDFISIARTNSDIVKILTIEEIIEACDPVSYIGCNDDLITETVNHFNQIKTISLL
ncbi:adenylosuccinate lyase family protein, partial [Escherichia coli]|nr:adenylosuccinate lyase family protein [Escherichia coli]EFZ4919658.1 adenylosuccinate lyase family protein [Shigella boydii]EHX1738393.1 adenylosuccinate lyase family protein [Shigella boydii]